MSEADWVASPRLHRLERLCFSQALSQGWNTARAELQLRWLYLSDPDRSHLLYGGLIATSISSGLSTYDFFDQRMHAGTGIAMEARDSSYLERFSAKLKSDWTHVAKAACLRKCQHPREGCCKRRFMHTAEIIRWMKSSGSNDSVQSNDATPNADRLLNELSPEMKRHRSFPLDSKSILEGKNKCVLVFSILLEQGYGHLIDLFQDAKVYDTVLELPDYKYQDKLRKELNENKIDNVNQVIESFEEAKWAYLPSRLSLHMTERFEGGKFVMPFCRRETVNEKGGTASVSRVAVKEQFIVDQGLQEALKSSLYDDPDFGNCYQMALKSYSSGMRTVYNWEKDAFFALRRDDSRAIVNYFGSYSHDEPRETPEGIVNDTTYNILLEYGQMDLDEYCADLANVPPVRAMEVIRFWESFCTIADAIRRVHNFRIRQGKQENFYNGWHADIKPDNILVVNGEFRLADFGFAKFSETVKNTTLPTEYIEGGTDTYGAPEFARMKQSGTRTTVTQTIDTWSFGCVLSVVAAWIILGFQGIRQYEMLRKMANSRLGVNTDRFHDGNDLLPEIKDWHDFLRTHMRTSDTATPLILELIETRMLRAHPEDRHESEKLCKELASLKQRATREHDDKKVRETEGCVKKALLVMDKYAVLQDDKTSRVDGLHVGSRLHVNIIDEGPKPSQFHMPVQTQNHESNRAGKDKRMLDVPYAKTPHRKEILEEEMKDIRLLFGMSEEGMPSEPFSKHFGETTDSPINDTPPQKAGERWGGRLTPRNPASRSISPVYRVPIPPPASRPSGSIENEAFSEPRIPARGISPAPSQAPGMVPRIITSAEFPDQNASWAASPEAVQRVDNHQSTATEDAFPRFFNGSSSSSSKVNQGGPEPHNQTEVAQHEDKGKLPMTPESSRSPTIMTLSPPTGHPSPPHVYHLPFDICSVRRRLEAEKPRSNFEKWKAKIGKEVKDPELARHVVDRDIVLVVDNGSTMAQHWPTAQFVAQTLGMQVMPLDDDGIDVRFTINGAKYNKKALRGSNGIKELEKLLSSARPSEPQPEDSREATDMNFVFSDLFRDYWTKGIQKQTMILILTDAVWEGTSLDKMNQTIVRFAQEVEKDRRRFNPRHFTLGFIHIGDGVEEKRKLKSLDDDLCRKNGLNDIIDACSWKTRVRKMILGSLLAYEDETEADGDDVATLSSPQSPTASLHYEQQVLNRLFDEFNSGRLKVILPDLRSHHMHGASSRNSLSVSPSRHTFGLSTNRDATLTGTSLKSTETKSSWKDKFSAQFKSQG